MSPTNSAAWRTFAFGDPDRDEWLAGFFPVPGRDGVLLIGEDDGVRALAASIEATPEGGPWQVSAAEATVSIEGVGPAGPASRPGGEVDGFEQAATARATVAGATLELAGRRGERPDTGERLDSVRDVSTWFAGGETVAVTALRPRKPKGQEQDTVFTAVLEAEGPVAIVDPRLSTTYRGDGRVRRVGLELWGEDDERPPLRLSAEGLGRGGEVTTPGWTLTVDRLAGHRGGRDGVGVYLLARPA